MSAARQRATERAAIADGKEVAAAPRVDTLLSALGRPLARILRLALSGERAFVEARRVTADVSHYLTGLALRDGARSQLLFTQRIAGRTLRLVLRRPGHIEDALARDGDWERHVGDTLAFFVRPGGVLVDVGANVGWHSLRAAVAVPGCAVLAVEPNPFVRGDLERNCAMNSDARVTVHGCALGDHAGEAVLHAQRDDAYNRGSSSLQKNSDLGDRSARVAVPLTTLDALVGGEARVDAIKIDTEGTEAAVLRGARATIARCRPVIVLEFESRYFVDPVVALAEIRALLGGYRLHVLGPDRAELSPLADDAVRSRLFRADLFAIASE